MNYSRPVAVGLLCAMGTVAYAIGPQTRVRTFDLETPGAPPAGFTFAMMRQPDPGAWEVRREAANGFLMHPAAAGSRGFSMAIADGAPLGDVSVSVRMRLGGRRLAGIISRYQDPRNYYMTVLDLGDGQLRMFRVFEGNRNQIEYMEGIDLDPNAWHTLKVVHDGRSVRALIGGVPVFEDPQRVNSAFPPGRCGVITSGDTDAAFDDFHVSPIDRIHNRP